MKFNEILPLIENIPHMTREQGSLIYNLILENDITSILELGIAHGTGSCYMAAALDEKKQGNIITIDNKSALDRKPNVFQLSKDCGLSEYIHPVFANSSYNWELMKLIDEQTKDGVCQPIFDFCYLDGAHNFEIDCCAFFLVDKLLKPNGLILFDDLNWTYGKSPSLKNTRWVKQMAEDEKTIPHVRKLVELMVLPHPDYHQASIFGDWFLARKKDSSDLKTPSKINLDQYAPSDPLPPAKKSKNVLKKIQKKLFK